MEDTSSEWDHALFILWLAYFTKHHVAYLNISVLFMAEQYSTVWIYHILFSHSSDEGHLGCFHFDFYE
jgi:hypothetical protein